jgi:hypothetical protein
MNLMGYLNDHLAGAAAGIQLAERCRDRDPGSELGLVLQAMVIEIKQDREVLERVIRVLGGSPDRMKRGVALGAERLGSLRMWLPMLGPGSEESARLEEVEVLSLGIEGKRLMWAALAQLSSTDARLSGFPFPELKQRAKSQRDRLERFRLRLAAAALGSTIAPMRATA